MPDYYVGYGDKYIRIFTDITDQYLSDKGKVWLKNARHNLQKYMERGFKENITDKNFTISSTLDSKVSYTISVANGTQGLELESLGFRKFAFKTHAPAYIDAGFATHLSMMDMIFVGLTPDFNEWIGSGYKDTFAQAFDVGMHLWRENNMLQLTLMADELSAIFFSPMPWRVLQRNRIMEFVFKRHGPGYTIDGIRNFVMKNLFSFLSK